MTVYQGPILFGIILALLGSGGVVALSYKNWVLGILLLAIGAFFNFSMGEALFVAKLVANENQGALVSSGAYVAIIATVWLLAQFTGFVLTWIAMTSAVLVSSLYVSWWIQLILDDPAMFLKTDTPLYERIYGGLPVSVLVVCCAFIGFIATTVVRNSYGGQPADLLYDPDEADQH